MALKNMFLRAETDSGITDDGIREALKEVLASAGNLNKVLIIPPDITRLNAYAGEITKMIWDLLPDTKIDILPALGTHMEMTEEELEFMFPGIPYENFKVHDWRNSNVHLGTVPKSFVEEVSDGRLSVDIDVEIDRLVMDPSYDLVISVGQVVPHEVVGMANYNKNLFVGCGGNAIINTSHYLGALYGMERMMGKADTPVRKVLNYAEDTFMDDVKLMYALTATTTDENDKVHVQSLALGRGYDLFERTVEVSQELNIKFVEKPIKKCVAYLKPEEFRTTWVGNKAIYRTRMAMADEGELIILAPGVKAFGEDPSNDVLIGKYGYVGFEKVAELVLEHEELAQSLGVAAHLIHGSSEDRFKITYAPGHMTKEQIEGVNFAYMPYEEAVKKYDPTKLRDGWNEVNGEEIYFISNPALGLWAERVKFYGE